MATTVIQSKPQIPASVRKIASAEDNALVLCDGSAGKLLKIIESTVVTQDAATITLTVPKDILIDTTGSALIHTTGSSKFNIGIRAYAKKKGLILNQYGLFNREDPTKLLAGRTEVEVFNKLGVKFVPPKERTDFWRVYSRYKLS